MKREFFDLMSGIMHYNKDVYLLFLGLGWPRIYEFLSQYPDRCFNVDASEQSGLDIAVGLVYEGKIPFVYTISPFLLRGFETVRTYINHENLPVKMVGVGVDYDYKHDGWSHHANDIPEIFKTQKNVIQRIPQNTKDLADVLTASVSIKSPELILIKR